MSAKEKGLETASSFEFIDVLIVINTDWVRDNYPNPSQNPDAPTGIAHAGQYMIANDPRGIISGQGTADLNFNAKPGDQVAFRGTSIYQNSDDAVIIYGIKYWSGANVFNNFITNRLTRTKAVVPNTNPSTPNGLPADHVTINFMSLNSSVATTGTENFYVYFALYIVDPNDSNNQILFGYYYWDPTITVK